MSSIEQLLYNPRTSSFLGCSLQQQWADLAVWEEFFKHRALGSVIELGTGYCGMSVFFLLQCIQRGFEFYTVDIKKNSRLGLPLAQRLHLSDYFTQIDIFEDPSVVESMIKLSRKPTMLFCDDGKKPKEFELFVPALEKGDYVAVHDWLREINEDDVEGFSIEPILGEECEVWNSLTRFWRIK